MGLAFFAPLFFAGAALIAVPYLIHQIRRPEREPLRFSSLIFVPNMPREIIERRRIQHILLMLLRMLMYLLLALAFSRPFWKVLAANEHEAGPAVHVIALDVSYSMGAIGAMEEARKAARDIVQSRVAEGDRVGVVTFGSIAEIAAPVRDESNADAGSKQRALAVIDAAAPSEEATDYISALQMAQQAALGAADSGDGSTQYWIHLISDFRRNGMPDAYTGWKLSPAITLDSVDVEPADAAPNRAIADVGVKRSPAGELRVLGKIKNWASEDAADVPVTIYVNEVKGETKTLSLKAGNASQIAFTLEGTGDTPIEGWLELERDGLSIDNKRYFTWNPPRKKSVLIAADKKFEEQWPAGWFFQQALADSQSLPWKTSVTDQAGLAAALANPGDRPAVVVLADLNGVDANAALAVREFVRGGGQALLVLNSTMEPDIVNAALLSEFGLRTPGRRFDDARDARFDLLSWVDFDHEIFATFNASKFNDFSSIRFYNHARIEIDGPDAVAIARFEDESTAIVEAALGEGRLIVWPFGCTLDWTNFPKGPRFVPFLHETLAYLSGLREGARAWQVGDLFDPQALAHNDNGDAIVRMPAGEDDIVLAGADTASASALQLPHAGFIRSKPDTESGWLNVDAVNVDAGESDPAPITPAELELKLAAAPKIFMEEKQKDAALLDKTGQEYVVKTEYGRAMLALLVAALLIESWYMIRLSR